VILVYLAGICLAVLIVGREIIHAIDGVIYEIYELRMQIERESMNR